MPSTTTAGASDLRSKRLTNTWDRIKAASPIQHPLRPSRLPASRSVEHRLRELLCCKSPRPCLKTFILTSARAHRIRMGAGALPLSGHGNTNIGLSVEKINDGNCLNDRFTLSVTALNDLATAQKNVPGRAIAIWIGPGWPLLAGPEFHPDTPATKANFFDHTAQLSRTLREAQVTVDAVSSPDMFRKPELSSIQVKSFAEGPHTEEQATASDLEPPW